MPTSSVYPGLISDPGADNELHFSGIVEKPQVGKVMIVYTRSKQLIYRSKIIESVN